MLTCDATAEVVGIELDARLCGIHLHCAAADRIFQHSSERQLLFLFLVQHVAMIIAGAILELLVVGVNVLTNSLGSAEIERGVFHKTDFARRNTRVVDGQVVIGIDLAFDVLYCRRRIGNTCQREESVVGQVDDGHFVCCGHVVDVELIVVVELIDNRHSHFSREAFLAVRTDVFQHERLVVHLQGFPNLLVETMLTAVQAVGTVVDGQHVLLAVQLESSLADAVAVAADERGKIGLRRIDHILNVVVALDHVGSDTVFVRYHDGDNCATVVGDGHFIAILIS